MLLPSVFAVRIEYIKEIKIRERHFPATYKSEELKIDNSHLNIPSILCSEHIFNFNKKKDAFRVISINI